MAPLDTPRPFGVLSLEDVLREAAKTSRLKIGPVGFKGWAMSEPLATFGLRGVLLEHLKASEFELDARDDGVTTLRLTDTSYPAEPGYRHNNYWNFRTHKGREGEKTDKLKLSLRLKLVVSERLRGVVCRPFVEGTFLSAGDQVPHTRLAKALVEWQLQNNPNKSLAVHPLMSVATQLGEAVVAFSDIGVGGLRTIEALFAEFVAERRTVDQLARTHMSPFDPAPYGQRTTVWFVPEQHQAALLEQWRRQLAEYKDALS